MADKRNVPVTAKISSELLARARAVAEANDISLSELINDSLAERVDREYRYVEKLSAVFQGNLGVSGKPREFSEI